MYYLVGYNLMYPGDAWTVQNIIGAFSTTALDPVGLAETTPDLTYASVGSDFFFQLMFCATTASIVSGTLAERIKLSPFLIFTVVLTGLFQPLRRLSFQSFLLKTQKVLLLPASRTNKHKLTRLLYKTQSLYVLHQKLQALFLPLLYCIYKILLLYTQK